MFRCFAAFEKQYGGRIPAEIYTLVFDGELEVSCPEKVFVMFNTNHPAGYTGRSLSMSDVVEFVDEGVFYFCDMIGFKKVAVCARERKGSLLQ